MLTFHDRQKERPLSFLWPLLIAFLAKRRETQSCLRCLAEHERITAQQVESLTGIKTYWVGAYVAELQLMGLLISEGSDESGRLIYRMTPKGMRVYRKLRRQGLIHRFRRALA